MSNGLDPDQDQDGHSVGPDLGPNCLQRLSADKKVAASKDELEGFHISVQKLSILDDE